MPGFNIGGTADPQRQKSNVSEPRRKHRWLVSELGGVLDRADLVYLQSCSRPNFKYLPAEMHHDQEVAYFAGKQEWDPIDFTFYDMEQDVDVSAKLKEWVTSVTTSWNNIGNLTTVALPSAYKKDGVIEMTKGDGETSESWRLLGIWPMETNWNELDYTSNDVALVVVKARIDRAIPE